MYFSIIGSVTELASKTVIGIGVIFLIVIILGAMFYFNPELFDSFTGQQESILAVSNINIEPRSGSENPVTKEWTGSFWTVLMTTDSINDQYGFYQFDKTETAKYGNDQVDGKKLVPQSTITVKITPLRPYWERPLDIVSVQVYPATKTAHGIGTQFNWENPSVGEFDVPVVRWGSQYWVAHTPYQIDVSKDGKNIITQTIDTTGTSQTYTLRNPNDSSEWLVIKDIGKLGTGYSSPTIGDIAILSPDTIFTDYSNVVNYLTYSSGSDLKFANYWFGGGNLHFEWQSGAESR